jgi:hypothetical protein
MMEVDRGNPPASLVERTQGSGWVITLVDGPFFKAAPRLIERGFALPWLDRCPRQSRGYSHATYDVNGERHRN